MTRRIAVVCLVLALWTAVVFAAADKPNGGTGPLRIRPAPKPPAPQTSTDPAPGFLPGTTVLATVGNRSIHVSYYVESYFDSWPENRPAPDSAGRAEFLGTLITKAILDTVALETYHDLTFEDRITMREHTQRVLSNILYRRVVFDSIHVEEADARRIYPQLTYEMQLHQLAFRDLATATSVREALVKGRMTWTAAAAKQGLRAAHGLASGDMGWVKRDVLDPTVATTVFDLKPGQFLPVLFEIFGFTIYQAGQRRDLPKPPYNAVRTLLIESLKAAQAIQRSEAMLTGLRQRSGMTYDTANIVWAARLFPEVMTSGGPGNQMFELDSRMPEFAPSDTSRVLARFPDRTFTLGAFLSWYGAQSPYTRVSANSFPALRRQVDLAAMEPLLADVARERGLDQDSLAMDMIEGRRKQILVERLYQDSVMSHVRVTDKERHDYYEKNLVQFMTYARVRYARIHRETKREADSIAAVLRSGGKAEAIVIADSLAGRLHDSVEWRTENEHLAYQKQLFSMRRGEVSVEGARDGHQDVLQILELDPGRQLKFEESERMIDESVQNIAAQKILDDLIARHGRRLGIHSHPELVMRIQLVDPTL